MWSRWRERARAASPEGVSAHEHAKNNQQLYSSAGERRSSRSGPHTRVSRVPQLENHPSRAPASPERTARRESGVDRRGAARSGTRCTHHLSTRAPAGCSAPTPPARRATATALETVSDLKNGREKLHAKPRSTAARPTSGETGDARASARPPRRPARFSRPHPPRPRRSFPARSCATPRRPRARIPRNLQRATTDTPRRTPPPSLSSHRANAGGGAPGVQPADRERRGRSHDPAP